MIFFPNVLHEWNVITKFLKIFSIYHRTLIGDRTVSFITSDDISRINEKLTRSRDVDDTQHEFPYDDEKYPYVGAEVGIVVVGFDFFLDIYTYTRTNGFSLCYYEYNVDVVIRL